MHVFLTGATGTIGSAVVPELQNSRHSVVALARSDASAAVLSAAGVEVVRGDISDLDSLRAGAKAADGVIHLAFNHDFTVFDASIAEEGRAIGALGEALIGSDRPLVIASGTPVTPGRASTEDDPSPTEEQGGGRGRNAQSLLDLADQGVRSAVIRLPRTVHNAGEGGFAGLLVENARRTGISGYPGDGTQRWPAVHALDTARLFRLALEQAPPGTVAHAVADEGDPVSELAAMIGRRLGLPSHSVPTETFGPLGPMFLIDQPSSSPRTRERFDWTPTHPSLLEDLETHLMPDPRG